MLRSLLFPLRIFVVFLLIFVFLRTIFVGFNYAVYNHFGIKDILGIFTHGIIHDLSLSAYLSAIPFILLILVFWFSIKPIKLLFQVYFAIFSAYFAIILVVDLILFGYWGTHPDASVMFYLNQPKDVLASLHWYEIFFGFAVMIVAALTFFFIFNKLMIPGKTSILLKKTGEKIILTIILLLFTGTLLIPVRGGISESSMNIGKVYFSVHSQLNQAAVNPYYYFLESLVIQRNFKSQYRFTDDKKAATIFNELTEKPNQVPAARLLKKNRPNIVIIVLESFMSKIVEPVGGIPGITPRLNQFCGESILFTNFYANSFRTDRGLVSILSGYPSQPTNSIMKYTNKTRELPAIPRTLIAQGYLSRYYYGGDADFANMRSYLVAMGIDQIVSEPDFHNLPYTSDWGAPDEFVFNKAANDICKYQAEKPFLKIIQTLSSHQPYDVPYHKFKDPFLNSVSYADSCLGNFIDKVRKSPQWKNTLIIMLPDHCMSFPGGITYDNPERYKIPMIWMGGAIKKACKIDTCASQIDLAATLLYQLHIPHKEFIFSKNILNTSTPHFAWFSYPDGFGFVNSENKYVFDHEGNKIMYNTGSKNANKAKAEAFVQVLYNDLSER